MLNPSTTPIRAMRARACLKHRLRVCLFIFIGTVAHAGTAAPGTEPFFSAQEHIHKQAAAASWKKLPKAWEALTAKNHSLARKLARAFAQETAIADYSHWIQALADSAEAKQSPTLISSAKNHLLQIEGGSAYSPLARKVPAELAKLEFLEGDRHFGRKQFTAAIEAYASALQRISSASMVSLSPPESLKRFAEACAQKKAPAICDPWLRRLNTTYSDNSPEMKLIQSSMPPLPDRPKPPAFSRIIAPYKAPDTDVTDFDSAMASLWDGKYSDAAKGLQAFLDEYPKSTLRPRARYWMGQALLRDKQTDRANQTFEQLLKDSPISYYGLLAALAANRSYDSALRNTPVTLQFTDPYLSGLETVRLLRAEKFLSIGFKEGAAEELREIKPRDTLSAGFILYLAWLDSQASSHSPGFTLLTDLIQRGETSVFTVEGLELVFPIDRYPQIKKAAEEAGIDPVLAMSLIKQESAFDPDAISRSGAAGFMQVMPATALEVKPGIRRTELADPSENLAVGSKYLKSLISRFKGNWIYAIAGYNAGPYAVDRWIKDFDQAKSQAKRGPLEFIESIPYKETRDYVSSIIRNYFWYCKRLGVAPPKSIDFFAQLASQAAPQPASPSPLPEPEETGPGQN